MTHIHLLLETLQSSHKLLGNTANIISPTARFPAHTNGFPAYPLSRRVQEVLPDLPDSLEMKYKGLEASDFDILALYLRRSRSHTAFSPSTRLPHGGRDMNSAREVGAGTFGIHRRMQQA